MGRKRVVLISFNTRGEKFKSAYERNKFFRGLYGWKQIIPKKEGRNYEYRRHGLLDEMPHIKVSDSTFIIPSKRIREVEDYFDKWAEKVMCDFFDIDMSLKKWEEKIKKRFFLENNIE